MHSCAQAPGRQRGTSAVEFTLVAIPMLLVGLGTLELARWFFIKQAISLALLEAGRAGIIDHARPATIEKAFERALLPLFPATTRQSASQRLQRSLAQRQAATGAPAWQIRILSPDTAAFHDFASSRAKVSGATGLPVIDNNYQAEQHQSYLQQGRPGGRGPVSGLTVFEANTLVLQLSYMHKPLVPGMKALMSLMSNGTQGYARAALAGGYLPMRQTIQLAMQSHPVAWSGRADKVVPGDYRAPPNYASALSEAACVGLWCPATTALQAYGPEPPGTESPPYAHDVRGDFNPPGKPPETGGNPHPTPKPDPSEPTLPSDYDVNCGTVLCCL